MNHLKNVKKVSSLVVAWNFTPSEKEPGKLDFEDFAIMETISLTKNKKESLEMLKEHVQDGYWVLYVPEEIENDDIENYINMHNNNYCARGKQLSEEQWNEVNSFTFQ